MIATIKAIRAKIKDRGEYRFGCWGTFWHRFAVADWRFAIALCKFSEHWSLHLFCLWVTLWDTRTPPHEMMESWGFTYDGESKGLHLNWGRRYKILHMPWAMEWVRTEHGMPDGSFVTTEREGRLPHWWVGRRRTRLYLRPDGTLQRMPPKADIRTLVDWPLRDAPGRYVGTFPYRYTLRSGEVQDRIATVTTDRMTHCYRLLWLFGIFWPARTQTSIWVSFSDEVGEGSGSWKGGVTGCGSNLLPGETPEACLRRMERERRFNR